MHKQTLDAPALYRSAGAGLKTWAFLKARALQTPYPYLASLLPKSGSVLDMACGHGLLSTTLALHSPKLQITAVDCDARRLEVARKVADFHRLPIAFHQAMLLDFLRDAVATGKRWDGIALIDSLHYMPLAEQHEVLRLAAGALQPRGVFLLREVNAGEAMRSGTNKLHEWLLTRIGFTMGEELQFQTREQLEQGLSALGLRVEIQPMNRFGYSDLLFIASRDS